MALNLIGLGLNENSITVEALEAIKKSDEVYLENYTVDFPYDIKELEKSLNTKITPLPREEVEDESIIQKAKSKDISLLVYGDALSATTHAQLLIAAKKLKVKTRIFHNASILTAIAETGLQLYKFGKTASLPDWKQHTNKPKSFTDYIKQNQAIKAHTLILVDIGLNSKNALEQLEQSTKMTQKIVIISQAGTKDTKIVYDTIKELKEKKIKQPFAIIIPSDLHFSEQEFLESI